MNRTNGYSGKDVAIIVPTKDRPDQVSKLLTSLSHQNIEICQTIIVYVGSDISEIVDKFKHNLNIELYKSNIPGQLAQRNYGISKLRSNVKLVALFDDDIVVEQNAFNTILQFISDNNNSAGVSFNIINQPRERYSLLKGILGLTAKRPGKVLKSGLTTSNINLDKNIEAEWLCGGATIWKKHILLEYQHKDISTKWAIAEDLIFSFPVGKKYPLYVCADAHVRHEHINDYVPDKHEKYHGYNQTIWMYYFVSINKDLSKILFFYTLCIRMLAKLVRGIILKDTKSLYTVAGQLQGMYVCLKTYIFNIDMIDILNES